MMSPVHIEDEPDGRTAVGLGNPLQGALTWALDSAPSGSSWLVGNWDDVHGD
jgi:hypothetical protein